MEATTPRVTFHSSPEGPPDTWAFGVSAGIGTLDGIDGSTQGGDDPAAAALVAELLRTHNDEFVAGAEHAIGHDPAHELDQLEVLVFGDVTAVRVPGLGQGAGRGSPRRGSDVFGGVLGRHRWWGVGEHLRFGQGRLEGGHGTGDLTLTVVEPVGRPDAVELPAQALEVVLSEAFSVTSRLRRVVHPPVGFDSEHVAPGVGWMLRREVDPEPRRTDLALEVEPSGGQLAADIALEGVEFDAGPGAHSKVGAA